MLDNEMRLAARARQEDLNVAKAPETIRNTVKEQPIREALQAGNSMRDTAKRFGVSLSAVSRYWRGERKRGTVPVKPTPPADDRKQQIERDGAALLEELRRGVSPKSAASKWSLASLLHAAERFEVECFCGGYDDLILEWRWRRRQIQLEAARRGVAEAEAWREAHKAVTTYDPDGGLTVTMRMGAAVAQSVASGGAAEAGPPPAGQADGAPATASDPLPAEKRDETRDGPPAPAAVSVKANL